MRSSSVGPVILVPEQIAQLAERLGALLNHADLARLAVHDFCAQNDFIAVDPSLVAVGQGEFQKVLHDSLRWLFAADVRTMRLIRARVKRLNCNNQLGS